MVELKNICKIYKTGKSECKALENVSLKIKKGDFVALTGPSGSGKTTLMNILGLMDRPTSGEYLLNQKNISSFNDIQKSKLRNEYIGFVLQNYGLLDEWSVKKNISVPLLYSGKGKKEQCALVNNVLNQLGIFEKRNELVKNLSGGQKQRVAIARAIINKPQLILADEPTGALDRSNSEEVMNILRALNKKGITVLVVTHDSFVCSFCNSVVKIEDGKIKQ